MGWTEIALIGAIIVIGGGYFILQGAGSAINEGLNSKCPACKANPNSGKCSDCLDKVVTKLGDAWDSSYVRSYAVTGYGQDFYS